MIDQNTSKYNSKKIKGKCELCGNEGDDIHHLQYQKDANEKGFIKSFHKNHKANLANVCSKCHDEIHENNKKFKKVKTNKGYKIMVEPKSEVFHVGGGTLDAVSLQCGLAFLPHDFWRFRV